MLKRFSLVALVVSSLLSVSTVMAQPERRLEREKSNAASATTGQRVALVIGNSAYQNTAALPNPVNDATDMAKALSDLGFEVISGTNQTKAQMQNLIRQFGTRLTETKAVGLFYYAGHGISAGGTNYLIPVDADIQAEDEIEEASVSINFLLNKMAAAQNGFNMVILDACRNNPFARKWRNYRDLGDKGGLARIDAPTGTLIAYATKPGEVASDGTGRNGLYTSALLRQMRRKNVDVTKMLQLVRADVIKQSGGRQVPFDESSVVGDFYFGGNDGISPNNAESSVPNPVDVETQYWNRIQNSRNPEDFTEYLKEFSNGRYAPLARQKLRELSSNQSTNSSSVNNPGTTNKTEPDPQNNLFTLNDLEGKSRSFSELKGSKGTVLVFMSVQCPVDKNYAERINELASIYKSKGFNFIALNSNAAESLEWIKTAAMFSFPVLIDKGSVIADKFGAMVTPEVFVLGSKGEILYKGAIDDDRTGKSVTSKYLREALDSIIAGRTVSQISAAPFGCSIKRSN